MQIVSYSIFTNNVNISAKNLYYYYIISWITDYSNKLIKKNRKFIYYFVNSMEFQNS